MDDFLLLRRALRMVDAGICYTWAITQCAGVKDP